MKKVLLGLLCGSAMCGQAMQPSGTNEALNQMVRTLKYSRDPDNVAVEVWGHRGRWQGGVRGLCGNKRRTCTAGWATSISKSYLIHM